MASKPEMIKRAMAAQGITEPKFVRAALELIQNRIKAGERFPEYLANLKGKM